MEEDIQNYLPTVIFCGTLYIPVLNIWKGLRILTRGMSDSHRFPFNLYLSKETVFIFSETC